MGRRKIAIEYISDHNKRNTCFVKRKAGILKKVKELSILCGFDVALTFIKEGEVTNRFVSNGNSSVFEKAASSSSPIETNETIDKIQIKDEDDKVSGHFQIQSDEEEETAVDRRFLEIMPPEVLEDLGYIAPNNRQRTKSCPSEKTPHVVVDLNVSNQKNRLLSNSQQSCSYPGGYSEVPYVPSYQTIDSRITKQISHFPGSSASATLSDSSGCNTDMNKPRRPSFLELSDQTQFSTSEYFNNSSHQNTIESPVAITTPDVLNLLSRTPTLSGDNDSFFPQYGKDPSPLKVNEGMLNNLSSCSSYQNRASLKRSSASGDEYLTQVDKCNSSTFKMFKSE